MSAGLRFQPASFYVLLQDILAEQEAAFKDILKLPDVPFQSYKISSLIKNRPLPLNVLAKDLL